MWSLIAWDNLLTVNSSDCKWPVAAPLLSPKDIALPLLREVASEQLPAYNNKV